MSAYRTENGLVLAFDVDADGAVEWLPDTRTLAAEPNAEAIVNLDSLNADKLVGRTFEVPRGCDEDGEWLGRLCYAEHQDLDGNRIQILARNGKLFQVR